MTDAFDRTMTKINANLYGGKNLFGKKEKPLEADILYCSCPDKCSLYQEGKCLNCRALGGDRCKYGKKITEKGYTSKAKKYHSFREKYTTDDCYGKLSYPNSTSFAVIGNELWLCLQYVDVYKPKENDSRSVNEFGYALRSSHSVLNGGGNAHILKEEATPDFLNQIFTYVPRSLFGNEPISEYSDKIVPNILQEMRRRTPEIYKALVDKYPKYTEMLPDYIGKRAYIRTMVEGSVLTDCHGNTAVLRNGKLYCERYTKGFVPFDGTVAECIIEIGEKQVYKIDDNSQCDENTIFE